MIVGNFVDRMHVLCEVKTSLLAICIAYGLSWEELRNVGETWNSRIWMFLEIVLDHLTQKGQISLNDPWEVIFRKVTMHIT